MLVCPVSFSSGNSVTDMVVLVEKGKDEGQKIVLMRLRGSCHISLLKIQLQPLVLLAGS